MRGISRSELQLPSRQPQSFFSVAANTTTFSIVTLSSNGGAPTHTVVPPERVSARLLSISFAMPGGLEGVVDADVAGQRA